MVTGFTPDQLAAFLLVLIRVGTWVWIAPPFGGKMLPPLVRVGISVALAVPMTPSAAAAAGTVPTTPGPLAWAAVEQVLIGGLLGLVCLTLLSAVQSAGSLIDVVGGFSMAQGFDPLLMQQNAVMSRVYGLIAGVLLLVTGGYMVLLQGFANTFEGLPITGTLSLADGSGGLASLLSTMVVATLQIAAPIVGVAFLADVALGLMSRVAPALNAFALGFPIKIGLTLLLLALTVPMLPPAVLGLSDQAVQAMTAIAGGR